MMLFIWIDVFNVNLLRLKVQPSLKQSWIYFSSSLEKSRIVLNFKCSDVYGPCITTTHCIDRTVWGAVDGGASLSTWGAFPHRTAFVCRNVRHVEDGRGVDGAAARRHNSWASAAAAGLLRWWCRQLLRHAWGRGAVVTLGPRGGEYTWRGERLDSVVTVHSSAVCFPSKICYWTHVIS